MKSPVFWPGGFLTVEGARTMSQEDAYSARESRLARGLHEEWQRDPGAVDRAGTFFSARRRRRRCREETGGAPARPIWFLGYGVRAESCG